MHFLQVRFLYHFNSGAEFLFEKMSMQLGIDINGKMHLFLFLFQIGGTNDVENSLYHFFVAKNWSGKQYFRWNTIRTIISTNTYCCVNMNMFNMALLALSIFTLKEKNPGVTSLWET